VLFREFGRPLMREIGGVFSDPATGLVVVVPIFLILFGSVLGLMRIGAGDDPSGWPKPRNSGTSEPPPTSA